MRIGISIILLFITFNVFAQESAITISNTENFKDSLRNPLIEPFEGIDMTWQNGSDRRTENIW